TTVAGQNAKLTFAGSVDQWVSFISAGTVWLTVNIVAPDTTTVVYSAGWYGGNGFTDRLRLPQSGTYTIALDPAGSTPSTWTTQLYDVTNDFTADVTPTP